jgi:hypothetical protein
MFQSLRYLIQVNKNFIKIIKDKKLYFKRNHMNYIKKAINSEKWI